MSGFLISTSIVLLFLVCVLAVIVILMQKPSANAGMGAALGGGAAESVFGGESANVLTKFTSFLTILVFLLSFGLYLAFISDEKREASALDKVAVPSATETPTPVPVVTPAATVTPTPAPTAPAATAPTSANPSPSKPQTPAPAVAPEVPAKNPVTPEATATPAVPAAQ